MGAMLALLGVLNTAVADEVYHDDGLDVRWDNTLRYTAAFRLFPRDRLLLTNPNWDDGDRNFDPGLISNRLDLLSQFDVTRGDFGLRISAEGWYDSVYHQRNDNDSPPTFNPFSVPHDEFTQDVRSLHGADVQLDDAFVHGIFEVGSMSASFRLGRYALLWGESLFFADNGLAAGQAPTDLIREREEPGAYAKDIFLPVWQASAAVQLTDEISLSAYYQFAWREDRLPGSGSYFSYSDYQDAGGERIILFPGHYLYRANDLNGSDTGQFGLGLQVNDDEINYGFYAMRFNAKEPQLYAFLGAPSRGDGLYRLVYPDDVQMYGASFSTYVGDNNVAGELSYRHNMPLVSDPILVPPGLPVDTHKTLYAVGDTLHAQVSTVTTFGASPFWQRADLGAELAANDRVSIAQNPLALDPTRDRFAMAIQATFTPQYFEVLPGLDLGVPIGFGYGLIGNSSTDETQVANAGNLEIGVSATYRTEWQGNLSFTHFIGDPRHQLLADRDFISFSVQRTF
jgi:hypothetical protein